MDEQYLPEQQSLTIKVQNGTTRGDTNLCTTCRHVHIIRGNNNEQFVQCTYSNQILKFEVAECNRYFNANQPALYEMEEIAWRIVTKQAGRSVGFLNPQQFQKHEEERVGHKGPDTPPQRVGLNDPRRENAEDTTTM